MPRTEFYGIRHHGPGSARSLRRALEEFAPDLVLVEGPPEADAIVRLAADPQMVPPVALLAYTTDAGSAGEDGRAEGPRAAFWPFAEFSPEWQAIGYALEAGAEVRFCDLPAAHQLALDPPADPAGESGSEEEAPAPERIRADPLGWLARAAGYDDAERWWEDVVEHRGEGPSSFPAIAEAMAALREDLERRPLEGEPALPEAYLLRERRREAHMRRTLRRALRQGHERIAVVCGAWHVPALQARVRAGEDDRTLRGLPKRKVALTWVPWSYGRLARRSGYGAGVRSPGWYRHLFLSPDRPVERWLTLAARLLREEDLHVSSAHVIEAVRLAETLAALRGRPLAGLEEVTEAARAVLCEGAEEPLALIRERMVVGERLGSVPDGTPMVPVQRDLRAECRRLKLTPSARPKEQDLDLRRPLDLERSRLLHRLRLLDVPWGEPTASSVQGKGTFRETWTLHWRPELDVALIEAGAWGTTVRDAAGARARALAEGARTLAELTAVAERCLLADLDEALPAVVHALSDLAATDTDVSHLMAALPALVRTLRYGDVRGAPLGGLRTVVDGMVVRICVGLPPAARGLDEDAARELLGLLDAVHEALALLDPGPGVEETGARPGGKTDEKAGEEAGEEPGPMARWQAALADLLDRPGLHGLVEGRLTRMLHDAGALPDASDRMARAVSVGVEPSRAAAWIEGFLSGDGLVLVHDEALLRLVDGWIAGLTADAFTAVLPLLRRTFSRFGAPERRAIGERARALASSAAPAARGEEPDPARAAPAARAVARILGWDRPAAEDGGR
ncbi:DUF5682 family protein [Thermomonospora catenispora]|uniref:DUF5682 family protein n=1 Tax=Thermomonospora catenispora TaxID=2493090 RepID=UPI00111E4570|nr:DUF5682 family protein [Thermomonospora catenispora]TNY37170.1 hypothetical protein EIO00_10035 [Thermomonospora catenispora]